MRFADLVVVVAFSSTLVLAQDSHLKTSAPPDDSRMASTSPTAAIVSVPLSPLLRFQGTPPSTNTFGPSTELKLFSPRDWRAFAIPPLIIPGDVMCLKIRSYVMARDSRDSDSTHLVGYSTCQPASRYRLRTTQLQTDPSDR